MAGRETIIAEYLAGGTSYRKLSAKHGIKHQTIHEWVQAYQGRRREKIKVNHFIGRPSKNQPSESDVKKLQQELEKVKLHNKLLNAMIDIAQEQLGIPIQKSMGPSSRNSWAKRAEELVIALFTAWLFAASVLQTVAL